MYVCIEGFFDIDVMYGIVVDLVMVLCGIKEIVRECYYFAVIQVFFLFVFFNQYWNIDLFCVMVLVSWNGVLIIKDIFY